MVNKADMVREIASATGMTREEVQVVVNGVFESIREALLKNGHVEIRGFGTFKVSERAERKAVNPQTLETMMVPAKKVPTFHAAKSFKNKF
ncbi:HU family DNA-binding protein [bacterium]|nr:HU family DNA-binding protein [bacterium]